MVAYKGGLVISRDKLRDVCVLDSNETQIVASTIGKSCVPSVSMKTLIKTNSKHGDPVERTCWAKHWDVEQTIELLGRKISDNRAHTELYQRAIDRLNVCKERIVNELENKEMAS